jgi:hypothetical protein
MRKNFIGPILGALALAAVAALFVYFYIQINRLDKKVIAVQTAVVQDSANIQGIVNFFNSNLNAQTNK